MTTANYGTKAAMRFRAVLVIAVALVATTVSASDTFRAALTQAKENVKTEAGNKYDQEFGMSFGSRVPDIMAACTKGAGGDDLTTFDLVAKVAMDGTLDDVMVEPATKVAKCLSARMPRSDYPKPPADHYLVFVNMRIK